MNDYDDLVLLGRSINISVPVEDTLSDTWTEFNNMFKNHDRFLLLCTFIVMRIHGLCLCGVGSKGTTDPIKETEKDFHLIIS